MGLLSQILGWHDADHQRLLHADERELVLVPRVGMATYATGFAQATNAWSAAIPEAYKNGWILISITRHFYFNTAQDGTNNYTATLVSAGTNGAANTTLTNPSSTAAYTSAATFYELTENYNVALDKNHRNIILTLNPNSTPGTYFLDVSINYKLL